MSDVQCVRCGQTAEGLASNPFRSSEGLREAGEQLLRSVCKGCYDAWLKSSVKLVNDSKLDLREERSKDVWLTQMRAFLNLDGGRDPWRRFVDRRVRIETTSKVIATATVLRVDDEKIWLSDFEGGQIAQGFAPTHKGADGASGGASILRDFVLTIEEARS